MLCQSNVLSCYQNMKYFDGIKVFPQARSLFAIDKRLLTLSCCLNLQVTFAFIIEKTFFAIIEKVLVLLIFMTPSLALLFSA